MDDLRRRVERLSPGKRTLLSQRLGEPAGGAPDPAGGDTTLVAYIVPHVGRLPGEDELRNAVRHHLPDYMTPSAFVLLDALPRSPNGKVDRRALPAPDRTAAELDTSFVAPRTSDEELLASIWAEVLGLELVGVHDNFFEIGGHSLLAVQLLGRIREAFGVDLSMDVLFEASTVASTAAHLDELRSARPDQALPTSGEGRREEFIL